MLGNLLSFFNAVFVAAALAGGLRYEFGMDLGKAWILASLILSTCVWKIINLKNTEAHRRHSILEYAALGAALALSTVISSSPSWHVINGSSDSATHVGLYFDFVGEHPRTYEGFTGFYALLWLFNLFGMNIASAFSAVFAFVVCTSVTALWSLWFRNDVVLKKSEAISFLAGPKWQNYFYFFIFLLILAAVFLPIANYLYSEGFYGQCTGLALLITACPLLLILSGEKNSILQISSLFLNVVALRYTYGLNLGDALIATTIVSILLAIHTKFKFYRFTFLAFAVGAFAAAVFSYSRLVTLIAIPGDVLQPKLSVFVQGIFYLSIATVISQLRISAAAQREKHPSSILKAFLWGFVGSATLAILSCLPSLTRDHYFVYKYAFAAAACACVLLGLSIRSILSQLQGRWVITVVLVVALFASIERLTYTFKTHFFRMLDRIAEVPNNSAHKIYPAHLIGVESFIAKTLDETHSSFFGVSTLRNQDAHIGNAHFINMMHWGNTEGYKAIFRTLDLSKLEAPVAPPGACIFSVSITRSKQNCALFSFEDSPWTSVCAECTPR